MERKQKQEDKYYIPKGNGITGYPKHQPRRRKEYITFCEDYLEREDK